MSVKAKFVVQSIERQGRALHTETGKTDGKWGDEFPCVPETTGIKVNLAPVYAPKDANCENSQFWQATPNGQCWMQINNPAAFDYFVEGQEYYLTFDRA